LAGAIDFNTEMAVLMSTGCGARSAAAAFALVYRFFRAIFRLRLSYHEPD
jgi:hypothetical protein